MGEALRPAARRRDGGGRGGRRNGSGGVGTASVIRLFFFFQAEAGIRDLTVTGVQTCALPIYVASPAAAILSTVQSQVDSAVALRSSQLAFDAYITFEQVETEVRARNSALASDLEIGRASCRERV